MGYTAYETLVAPDVPDEINEVFHPIRPARWRLNPWATVGVSMVALGAVPYLALAAARAELGAMNAAFDGGYAALNQLCDQIDGIRQQIDIAAARQRLRAALAAADLPAAPAADAPDIETMSAAASAMVEFLRSSLA